MTAQNLDVLLNSLQHGSMIIDDTFVVFHWNKWLAINTQISYSQIVGKSLKEFYPDLDYHVLHRKIKTTLQLKTQAFYDPASSKKFIPINRNNVTTSSLSLMQQQVTISPYLIDKDQVMISIYDISELYETKLLLQEEVAKVSLLDQAKSTYLANMSHEIRTPMNAVMGFLELFSRTSMNQQQTNYIMKTKNAARTLLSLLNDILDLSKIEAGKLTIVSAPFRPKELFLQCFELFEVETHKKNILLEYEIDANLPEYLEGDIGRIRQILINLVSNAMKFTEHGSIHIDMFMHHCNNYSCSVEFVVSDTGIGIPKEKQSDLFDLFTQVDNSTTRKQGGTGLGLAICKQLVEAMGGTIDVESEEGEGSTFSFFLTLGIPEVSMLPYKSEEYSFNFNNLNILLVEDNDDNREVARELLTHLGAKIDEAINGKIAIEMIKTKTYDIVLMDIQMPEMDGLSATRILREEGFANLPIIAMSAHTSKEEQQRSLSAGMNSHLNKPFRIRDLESIFIHYFPDKAVKKTVLPSMCETCWANELPTFPGIVLDNDICDFWLSKDDYLQKYEQFVRNILTESKHLHELLEKKNISMALKLLHKLKGSVKLYGAKRLFEAIEQLEDALPKESIEAVEEAIKGFDAAVCEVTGQ